MKLFRKIRQSLIKEGNLKRYIPYAIGEILLVMIGILLAFQVNKWNDLRIKKNNEFIYYQNIKDQIVEDKNLINDQIEFNKRYLLQFQYANEIIEKNDRSQIDTLGVIIRNLTQYSDFDRQANIYESMVNSGEIKLLKNHEIISSIRLLEERYNFINRMENTHHEAMIQFAAPAISKTIKLSNNKIMKPEAVYSFEFQNLILTLIQVMDEKDRTYTDTNNYIDGAIDLIDKELENR
ncbi:MAG: hypothetical protein HKO81_03590 [Flavobacteriaceae bacterium]|nr:hypothetical protein [Flavobacteriaceae bacterium]